MLYNKESNLWLPEDKSWRIYKFVLSNGKFIQLNKIRCIRELREYLIKYQPTDVYYSVCCFRNRLEVTTKQKLKQYNILSWDLVFDIDENPVIESKKLIDYMDKNYKLNPDYILVTNRGFQIVYLKNDLLRDELVEQITKSGIKIDKDITKDLMRVVRLPLTYMKKSGRVAEFISIDELYSKMVESFFSEGEAMKSILSSQSGGKARPTISAPPISTCKYMSNQVEGTKKYVLYLEYFKENIKDELLSLGNEYNIPYLYVIDYDDYLAVLSLKTFDLRRLEKIYNRSSASNKNNFLKFKKTYIPVTAERIDIVKQDGMIKRFRRNPVLRLVLGSTKESKDMSYPHSIFLKHLGAKILEEEENPNIKKIGGNPKIILAEKELRNLIC